MHRIKSRHILHSLIVSLALVSCFEDESTLATRELAEISIDGSSIKKEYNIRKNDTLIIEPVVTQSNGELPLTYTWELDQQVVSTEPVLRYVGEALGAFSARLIVENEDGKAFHVFALNVNSPYEYGITVLSEDAEGKPHIAFMQEPIKEGDAKAFYNENSLVRNNPEQTFASHPADMVQTTGSLIVACQGSDGEEDGAAIYFLNEKTLVVENIVESKEYKTFKPTKLFTPGDSFDGGAYPVLSADGKMYSLPTYNAVLQPSHKLLSTYAQTGFVVDNGGGYNDIILWDAEVNGLVLIYNSYGPYYLGSRYLLQRDSLLTDEYYVKNLSKLRGVCTLTPVLRTPAQKKVLEQELVAIVKAPLMQQKVVVATFFWDGVSGSYGEYRVLDNKGFTKAASKSCTLIDEHTPCVANATYETMLFANGGRVMRWYYNKDNHYLEDADVLLSVGSDEAVITSLAISDDHTKTFVAFYEPSQEGKNGSVWVFDTGTGTVLERYDGVCYRPVKVMWKKK